GDGGGGVGPEARAGTQGEADDGRDQQDRSARRAGAQSAPTGRDTADGVDSARRTPGPARFAAHPDGVRPPADAAQESGARHVGKIRPPRCRGERSLRCAWPCTAPAAHHSPAAAHGICYRAVAGTGRGAGRPSARVEKRIRATFKPTPMIQQLLTLPGVGLTLAVVIALEVGDVTRFATAENLAGYAGTTPRVRASGGRRALVPSRPDVNRYLKWAFVEAAKGICLPRGRRSHRHVSRLYERVAGRKGHGKAIGAVARHLAEATYWMLSKEESYREPTASRRFVHGG